MGTITRQAEIELDGRRVGYTLLRVPRRRHVHLVVADDGELQVRAPYRYSCAEAEDAIRTHANWVTKTLGKKLELRDQRPPLESGVRLPLLDECLTLWLVEEPRPWVVRAGEVLRVHGPTLAPIAVRVQLESWYRTEAGARLPARLGELAAPLGVEPGRVTIRAQRTRWGSCSSTGAISLNWRLLLVPAELADYVLVHELCHLRFLDHSPRFWRMVEGAVPNYRELRRALSQCQSRLAL